jgi:hypothetical protein
MHYHLRKEPITVWLIVALAHGQLRQELQYGGERLIVADIKKDLPEVLRITQNITGLPTFKVHFFRNYIIPAYKQKVASIQQQHQTTITNENKEPIGQSKSINTNNLKDTYLDDYIKSGWLDCEEVEAPRKHYEFTPIIDLETENNNNNNRTSPSGLSGISQSDENLQTPKLFMHNNLNEIPKDWLELEIMKLISYPVVLEDRFFWNKQRKNMYLSVCDRI